MFKKYFINIYLMKKYYNFFFNYLLNNFNLINISPEKKRNWNTCLK